MRAKAGKEGLERKGTAADRTASDRLAFHIVSSVVDVRLLGTLQVVDGSGQAVEVAGDLQRGLLALLVLEGPAPVPADRIVDSLWPGELPSSPASSLHVVVSRLRKAIGDDRIRREHDTYSLQLPAANSDVARFRRHVQRGRQLLTLGHPGSAAEAFRQALAQWRGPALSDLRKFEFVEQAARALDEERLTSVEALMEAELLAGDHALVVGELSGLVEAFPLRERLWGQLMLALYRSGRQADALRAYNRVRDLLAEELGVEPSAPLTELEERILLHDPALSEPPDPSPVDWAETPELVTFSPGEDIVHEGGPADAVYWIEAGEVEVYRETAAGQEVLAGLGPGRYFGELASLLGSGRTASVRAIVPTTVSVHTVESFRRRLGAERSKDISSLETADEVRHLMRSGQYLQAYDLASARLELGNADPELRYLATLALARSGATAQARRRFDAYGLNAFDPTMPVRLAEDVAALAARLDKDMALTHDRGQQRTWATRSAEGYEAAFDRFQSSYLAVNAATMWLVAGVPERAASAAHQALAMLADSPAAGSEDRYWQLASEAEAALVLGDISRAADALGGAGEASESAFAARATTLRQLRMVCRLVGADPALLSPIANPTVIHFCGHRLGGPEGLRPEDEARLKGDLAAAFDRLGAGIAYGSLAAGADVMAAEELIERGAELHIVLPFEREEFVRTSVAPAGLEWVRRFERCLASAAEVTTAVSGEYLDDPVLFDFCSQIAMGDALVRARQLEAEPHQVAIWDGLDAGQPAGTAVDVSRWRTSGHQGTVIATQRPQAQRERNVISPKRQIRSLLFGDFAGFSRLSDAQVLRFQERVMGAIANTLLGFEDHLLSGRTWGDGLHLVFSEVTTAAQCALELQREVASIDFESEGLSGLKGMRLAAHATPVFDGWDPISGARLFFGAGVTQTARIEPRTPEGEVYVTHPFAALAALAGDQEFACQYVGTLPTAKGYGSMPLYALNRRQ